jgi:hypothetical protein
VTYLIHNPTSMHNSYQTVYILSVLPKPGQKPAEFIHIDSRYNSKKKSHYFAQLKAKLILSVTS